MMLVLVATALLALGVILLVAGVILFALSGRRGREVRGAGVVIIGPFPILVASDKETARLAVLLTVAALAVFALFLLVSLGVKP